VTQLLFEIAAGILAATALASWVNAKTLKLPVAVGLLVFGLLVAALGGAIDLVRPDLGAGETLAGLVGQINYSSLVLNFMLAYLLFAGAMGVNLGALARRGVAVAVLAVVGTVITAVLIAVGFWGVAQLFGYELSPVWAMVFGVLVSPTDPIAVLAMTKRTELDAEVRAQLEGEALFNDGVAVVLFRAALAFAIAQAGGAAGEGADVMEIGQHVAIEALGGAAVGAVGGLVAVLIMAAVDDWMTETLVTVACATAVYALAVHFHLSGPIGVVVAGLVVGSNWGERSMSAAAKHYIRPFWHMVDEAMNAVLFFLAGLQAVRLVFDEHFAWAPVLAAPFLVLIARWLALVVPSFLIPFAGRKPDFNLVNVLTWAGVRGGLSLAMALSLPDVAEKGPILAATLAIVAFSIIIQSMTMEKLAVGTGYGVPKTDPEPTH
jgi:CPA1 family monovalent cation:H+ antiporter